jgi:serine/threonine-protein kinase
MILKNLENENFGVKELAEEIGISRYQLYRKIQLLSKKSVSQYIREVRLEEALELIKKGELTMSEITYRVGFSSPSYFNRCFKSLYGYSPTEVKNNERLFSYYGESETEIKTHPESNPLTRASLINKKTDKRIAKLFYRDKIDLLSSKPFFVILPLILVVAFFLTILVNWDTIFSAASKNSGQGVKYFDIQLPEEFAVSFFNSSQAIGGQAAFDISPDGNKVVYVSEIDGIAKLVLRYSNKKDVEILMDTDGAYSPFFSPDGNWIGYFTRDKMNSGTLKKISIQSGVSIDLCHVSHPFGGDWGKNGLIVYADNQGSNIRVVSENGGTPRLVELYLDNKEYTDWITFPKFLPDENYIIGNADEFDIISLKTGEVKMLSESGSNVHYIKTGHLLFVNDSKLMATPFDYKKLEITGNTSPLFQNIRTELNDYSGQFAISDNGDLIFAKGGAANLTRFMWVNRKGAILDSLALPPARYGSFSISSDGEMLSYKLSNNIYVYNLKNGNKTRVPLSSITGLSFFSPDGKKVGFSNTVLGVKEIATFSLDGKNEINRVLEFDKILVFNDWSADNKYLGFHSNQNIYVYSFEEDKIIPVLETDHFESQMDFSPDSRYFSYLTDENGYLETFVQAYPPNGEKWNISNGLGIDPLWSFDGEEIFYRNNIDFYVTKVNIDSTFTFTKPELLFTNQSFIDVPLKSFAVSPDRQKLLVLKAENTINNSRELTIVENWFDELRNNLLKDN